MDALEDRCTYCGAALDPNFYFCTTCGTPYQSEDVVLPRVFRIRLTTEQRIAKAAPQVGRLFWTYFCVVVGGSIVAHVLIGDDHPAIVLLFLDTILLATTVFFAVAYWPSLVSQLRHVGFDHWEAWVGLLALGPLLLVNYGYHSWLEELAGVSGESFIARLRDAGVSEGVLLLSICVFPAVTEEIAFRGLLQHWLQVAVRPFVAIVLASALFAAMHFSVLSAPYLFGLGCLLGWMKWRTGSLWPPMLAHLLHNLVVLESFAI